MGLGSGLTGAGAVGIGCGRVAATGTAGKTAGLGVGAAGFGSGGVAATEAVGVSFGKADVVVEAAAEGAGN